MTIVTPTARNEYDHSIRTITRIVDSKGYKINLLSRLPKTYDNLDPLELLNALANIDSEDFRALAEFQRGII